MRIVVTIKLTNVKVSFSNNKYNATRQHYTIPFNSASLSVILMHLQVGYYC